MTARLALAALLGVLALAAPASAQRPAAERLQGRVPADVISVVQAIVDRAAQDGLPTDPLVQKAIEGQAKGVASERVIAAVRVLAGRLGAAAQALRASGLARPDAASIEAGAFALSAGLAEPQLEALARASRPPYAPDQTLRVAGALSVLGVPAGESVELLVAMIQTGRTVADVLALPAHVQAGAARGVPAREAAREAGRRAGGGGGPPVHVPRPPDLPPRGEPGPPPGKKP